MRSIKIIVPLCAAVMAALMASATPAHAGDPADDATGIAVFNEGRQLASAGDWEHALPKFVEAQRLHPAAAILLNIAECHEHLNRLASAWGAWKQAEIVARAANDASREHEAAQHAAALVPQLAKLAIVVPPATRLPALEVRKDGALVGEGQWGSALPVDVGSHTIEATAPGHKAWSTVVRVETNGSSASVEIPALDVLASPGPSGQAPAPFWSTQRIAGASVGSVGFVGALIGAALGGVALSKASSLKSGGQCNAGLTVCNSTGLSLDQGAATLGNAATGMLVVGGAALVAGVVVFATGSAGSVAAAPKSGARVIVGPVAGAELTGMLVSGRW
jgi:hypothetical protein